MPDVQISGPQSTASKPGFGTGIPTPILLGVIGGGIGLVVFLRRKSSDTADTDKGTLLPNTAIMLGSLQQSMLELKGMVGVGNADLSSQLSGVGENLGLQIDTQTGQIQQGFADINSNITGAVDTLKGQNDAISSAISNLSSQNNSSFEGIIKMLQGLGVSNGQILAGLSNANTSLGQVIGWQNDTSSKLDSMGNTIRDINGNVIGMGSNVDALGRFLGWQFYQIPNRYAAFIPGQSPAKGNVGQSVIGSV